MSVRRDSTLVRGAVATLFALAAASCGGEQPLCASGSDCRTLTAVVSEMHFVKHNPDGSIEGFDLDHAVSTGVFPDATGCGLRDERDASGAPGIDNSLGLTFESVDALTNGAVDGLVKAAINAGTLLVIFRVEGVDDLVDDPRVTVRLMKGATETLPILATTGSLAPSQTFGVDERTPISTGAGYIENGILHAGPFEATIPLKIFAVTADIRVHGAVFRGAVRADGSLGTMQMETPDAGVDHAGEAMLGGGIEVQQVVDIAHMADVGLISDSAEVFLRAGADLAFDGESCQQISSALLFRTEPAFLLGDRP